MTGKSDPLTLSRQELYELVWSKPMLELAKDFGISDVALAKRCRRLGVPVPGRGYWARLDAGQTPHRPKLPKRDEQYGDRSALTVPVVSVVEPAASEPCSPNDAATTSEDPAQSIRGRIASCTISTANSLADTLPVVKRTAWHLKHPHRADLSFERGERTGPVVAIDVADGTLDRALLLADRVLRAAAELAWALVSPPPPKADDDSQRRSRWSPEPKRPAKPDAVIGELLVEGERVGFQIEERLREERREPSAAELAREKREYGFRALRKVQVPTGNLRIVRLDTYRTYGTPARQSWYDRKGLRAEEQIREVLAGFCELALSIKSRRAEEERRALERETAERRRAEREARRAAHAKLIRQLETDAGAWHRARYLRRYIYAARRVLGVEPLRAKFMKETVDFLDWAEQYVNQLDPLHPAARSEHFQEGMPTYYQGDVERMKQSFARLLGSEWKEAWKFGADYTPQPEPSAATRLFSSVREHSVFVTLVRTDDAEPEDA